MSPKFALAVLLLSCVLLGIANGQQRYQQRQQYKRPGVCRNMPPPDGGLPPDMGPPPSGGADGGAFNPDCMPNQLASKIADTRTPRPKPKTG
ncbi:uncharacterized protein LOC122320270 [Drosophila ficusphila]|uniref:uncharacterized protein LOC122320270 n=1 Tax=Drosophila ficusphila TaxID=30025 RepID=UPI001C8A5862|nr:uncharacterized protein LOC122320270 [Drosophila ficusphila]